MHLYRVPDEERAKEADAQPPEAGGAHGACQGPVCSRPLRIDDVAAPCHRGGRASHGGIAIGQQADILRAPAQQQCEWCQREQRQQSEGHAGRTPSRMLDDALQIGQQHDRAHANPRERNAHRKPAPLHEPGRQKKRLAGIPQTHTARAHQNAQGQIEMPGLIGERRTQHAGCGDHDADQRDEARAMRVHQPTEHRTQEGRDHEPE